MVIVGEIGNHHEGVWDQNVAALEAFLAVATQWRFAAPGDRSLRRLGLDYASARVGLDLAGIAMTPDLWRDVQFVEYAAIAASAEEAQE